MSAILSSLIPYTFGDIETIKNVYLAEDISTALNETSESTLGKSKDYTDSQISGVEEVMMSALYGGEISGYPELPPITWDDVLGKPERFIPEAHTHDLSDIENIETMIDISIPSQPTDTSVPSTKLVKSELNHKATMDTSGGSNISFMAPKTETGNTDEHGLCMWIGAFSQDSVKIQVVNNMPNMAGSSEIDVASIDYVKRVTSEISNMVGDVSALLEQV